MAKSITHYLKSVLSEKLADSLQGDIVKHTPRSITGPASLQSKATVILVMRRVGKTTYLQQLRQQHLNAGTSRNRLPLIKYESSTEPSMPQNIHNSYKQFLPYLVSILLITACHNSPAPSQQPNELERRSEWSTSATGEQVYREYLGNQLDGEVRTYSKEGALTKWSHWQNGARHGTTWTQENNCIVVTEYPHNPRLQKPDSSEACFPTNKVSAGLQVAAEAVKQKLVDPFLAYLQKESEDYLHKNIPSEYCAECGKQFMRGGIIGATKSFQSNIQYISNSPQLASAFASFMASPDQWASFASNKWISITNIDIPSTILYLPKNLKSIASDMHSMLLDDLHPVQPEMEIYAIVGYGVGWIAAEYAFYQAVNMIGNTLTLATWQQLPKPLRYKLSADKLYSRRIQLLKSKLTSNRLPETHGKWSGSPGKSEWISDLDEVKIVTQGKGIPFHHGKPDFSKWTEGGYAFPKGKLTGTSKDFPMIHQRIKQQKGFHSESEARIWLRENGLTPHHVDDRQIQLIPTSLHENIPHTGGAAQLRQMTH